MKLSVYGEERNFKRNPWENPYYPEYQLHIEPVNRPTLTMRERQELSQGKVPLLAPLGQKIESLYSLFMFDAEK